MHIIPGCKAGAAWNTLGKHGQLLLKQFHKLKTPRSLAQLSADCTKKVEEQILSLAFEKISEL